MRIRDILLVVGLAVAMQSCRFYSNYERPTSIDSLATTNLYRDVTTTDTTNFGYTPWREVFTDAKLQGLIEKALAQNTDLKTAALTIEQAEVGLKVKKLDWLPTVAFAPQGQISKVFNFNNADHVSTYSLPISASWQIDFFGKVRNGIRQGEMTLLQTKAAEQATKTGIICGVANCYYSLQMLDASLETTESTLKLWEKNIETIEAMKEAGWTNSAAVASAKSNYLQIKASVPGLLDNIRQLENTICGLLHEAPHSIERNAFEGMDFPEQIKVGIPVQMLSMRPDVKIAEYNLASCFYAELIAEANFYPSLTITGNGAFSNSLGSAVVNPGKFLASGVASLVQPLFQKGQLRAGLKVAKIQAEAAELKFEQSLIDAGIEVSNALTAYSSADEKATLTIQQLEQLKIANESTWELFLHGGGKTTYLETITAQMQLLQGELSVINDKYTKIQAAIKLYQALGGGVD